MPLSIWDFFFFFLLQQKHYRLRGLNSKHLFLTILDADKLRIKAPADLLSGEGPCLSS